MASREIRHFCFLKIKINILDRVISMEKYLLGLGGTCFIASLLGVGFSPNIWQRYWVVKTRKEA